MRITADTNVLIRAAVADDAVQAERAQKILREANLIAVSLASLCEFTWVLRSVYKFKTPDIIIALTALLNTEKIALNRPAVEEGIAFLEAGGDFADGIIAHEGRWLGGDTFVSFDKKAVTILQKHGNLAHLA